MKWSWATANIALPHHNTSYICTGYCTYKIKTHLSNGCALHQRTCKTLSAYVLRSVYYVTITEIANKKIR